MSISTLQDASVGSGEVGSASGDAAPGPRRAKRLGRLLAAIATLRTARPAVVLVCSLLSGLIVSSIVIVASVRESRSSWAVLFSHPLRTWGVTVHTLNLAYGALLSGALGKPSAISAAVTHSSLATWSTAIAPLGSTITTSAPLAIAGIGLAIAYRSGVFNIGAVCQMIFGGIAASWVGFSLGSLPMPVHVALGLLAATAGGAIGGFIPGLLKVKTGANEVIVTIMLNYIAPALLTWVISDTFFSQIAGSAPEGRLTLPSGMLPFLFGPVVSIDAGAIVAIVVLVFGWLLLTRSRLGFELEVSGMAPGAARLAGIRQRRVFLVAFCISGAIVGLGGGIQIIGSQHQLQSTFGSDIGVLAITVAFVGRNRPLGVLLAALLYGVLQNGGLAMQGATGLSYQLANVVEAVIVLFMVAPALVAELYRLRPAANAGLRSLTLSRGWGR